MQNIIGFFVQEDHILNTSNGLIDRLYLNELWSTSLSKIITNLKNETVSVGFYHEEDWIVGEFMILNHFSGSMHGRDAVTEN